MYSMFEVIARNCVLGLFFMMAVTGVRADLSKPSPSELESLRNGLCYHMAFDGDLYAMSPNGAGYKAYYSRDSEAWTPKLDKVGYGCPRFLPGKFGQSLFIEYGSVIPGHDAGRNKLNSILFTPLENAKTTPSKGPSGTPCVEVAGDKPGLAIPGGDEMLFSIYLKGKSGQKIGPLICDGTWQRMTLPQGELRSDQPFLAAAPMLEKTSRAYGGKTTPSSWQPPFRKRPGDKFELPPPDNPESGTLSFWFKTLGKLNSRKLLSFDKRGEWRPTLAVSLTHEKQFSMNKAKKNLPPSEDWRHLSLRWHKGKAELFINGVKIAECSGLSPLTKPVQIGGTSNRADALFDELSLWNRSLSDKEIAALATLPSPLGDTVRTPIRIIDLEPVSVYPRDYLNRRWNLELLGHGSHDLTVRWGILGAFSKSREIDKLPCKLSLEWSPALLLPGKYHYFVEAGKTKFTKEIEIVPARIPRENVQTIAWGTRSDIQELKNLGISCAGKGKLNASFVENANRNGLYSMLRANIEGEAMNKTEWMLNTSGKATRVDQRALGPRASLEAKATLLGKQLGAYPDLRFLIINTEHLWITGLDFRPSAIQAAKERFGLDLSKWIGCPKNERWRGLPGGCLLGPSMGGIEKPVDGVVSLNDPLYAYLRWWHSDQAGNEIFLNDLVATKVRERAPWIKSIVEPVLRRPPVRAFKAQDILEEWFYFENPLTAISVQERLAAAARGTGAEIAGMPQILFKAGGAAPQNAIPTPDLFRETMWLCLSRPSRIFSFWGTWMALHPEKGHIFVPELRGTINQMLKEVVEPLGALLPHWRNRPRQVALYNSFAGKVYGGWSRLPPVLEAVTYPYDVIYDQDFESNPNLLDTYQAVVLQSGKAVTAPAAEQLRGFVKRGGLLLADQGYDLGIENVFVIDYRKGKAADKIIRKKHLELLERWGAVSHPQYLEDMELATSSLQGDEFPVSQAVETLAKAFPHEITVSSRYVRFNSLKADGANYLVAVNNLRASGPHFGKYGIVLEKGLPLNGVSFKFSQPLGTVAYELLACRELPLNDEGIKLDLPPAGGKAIIFLPERIKNLRLNCPSQAKHGELVDIKAEILGESGNLVPGVLPVRLDVTRPDGAIDSFSCYMAFKRGKLSFSLPIPVNSPVGAWRIDIKELVSGRTAKVDIAVK